MKKLLAALFLMASANLAFANVDINTRVNITDNAESIQQKRQKQTFTLNLWAPDQTAPSEAKIAEAGNSYQYLYTPGSLRFSSDDTDRVIKFRFHQDVKDRYQFRWVTATHPQHVTMLKKGDDKIVIALDDGEVASQIYFEVWVYDTETGKVFLCDPTIVVGGGTEG